jgi:hypothetical protein
MSEDDIKERKYYQKKIDDLWLCVLGNGHPEHGIKWKVEQMMEFTGTVKRVFWLVVGVAIAGGLSAVGLFVCKVISFMIGQNAL